MAKAHHDIPISIAPAVEPAMMDRSALGRCFFSAAAGSLVTVAIALVLLPNKQQQKWQQFDWRGLDLVKECSQSISRRLVAVPWPSSGLAVDFELSAAGRWGSDVAD